MVLQERRDFQEQDKTMAAMIEQNESHLTDTCEDCDSEDNVNWMCTDCQHKFCNECKNHHVRSKKTRNHVVELVNVQRASGLADSHIRCTVHPGNPVDYFCETCDAVICAKCMSAHHKKHDWCSADEQRAHIRRRMQGFRHTLAQNRGVINDDHKMSVYFSQSLKQLRVDVTNRAVLICEETNKIKEGYLKELNMVEERETIKNNSKQAKMKDDMSKLNDLINDTDQKLDKLNSILSISALTKDIEDKARRFQCPEASCALPPTLTIADGDQIDKSKLVAVFGQLDFKTENVAYEVKTTTIKTKSLKRILAICVLGNFNMWVSFDGDRYLLLIDQHINVIRKSCSTELGVVSMAIYKTKEIVFTRFMDTRLQRLNSNGDKMSTVADMYPYSAKGVCVQDESAIFICCVTKSDSKIVKLNGHGQTLLEITTTEFNTDQLTLPYRISCFISGEVCVVDMATSDHRVTCLDKQGDRVFSWSWRGEGVGTVDPLGIASDDKASYITDEVNNRIYVLPKNGRTAAVLWEDSTRQKGPRCITVDKTGRVWVGCSNGIILIIDRQHQNCGNVQEQSQ